MRIQCFMIEPARASRYTLRRYRSSGDEQNKCPGGLGYHNAHSPVIHESEDDPSKRYYCTNPPATPANDDPRWPVKCDACEYRFSEEDQRQVYGQKLFRRADTGEVYTLEAAPAGAMWDADWWPDPNPQDGKVLMLRLPDGFDWMIDGKANNCACPADPAHRCWTRSGVAPNITASPSILTPKYHGWLRGGILEDC